MWNILHAVPPGLLTDRSIFSNYFLWNNRTWEKSQRSMERWGDVGEVREILFVPIFMFTNDLCNIKLTIYDT